MKKGFVIIFVLCVISINAQTNYPKIVISTNYGDMTAILYDQTPNHSAHFLKLINQGYFDGTLFHRVIQDFMIQGGAQDSRNAPAGAAIGTGRNDMEIMPEFNPNYFHKKGALCTPRQGDKKNPKKKSDASQFYIVQGKVYSSGRLDTLEMAINVPIKNKIIRTYYTPRKAELTTLKEKNPHAFNNLLGEIMQKIDSAFAIAPSKFYFSPECREAYTSIGGVRKLDGEYTVFGEIIDGLYVIDKIAALSTDSRNRPVKDAKIIRIYIRK